MKKQETVKCISCLEPIDKQDAEFYDGEGPFCGECCDNYHGHLGGLDVMDIMDEAFPNGW